MSEIPSIQNLATQLVQSLNEAGHTAYFAGGCVRDMLMGREPKDYDIATSAVPDEVEALFQRTHAIGKDFGVIQVLLEDEPFEVATFRTESGYQDGRHPTHVEHSGPEEDAQRRDFTINGLFYDPIAKKVIDFVGGEADIKSGIIRAIGHAEERFQEDHLRMLRAARFSSVLGFPIEAQTREAVIALAPNLKKISVERIREEFVRLLTESEKPGDGLVLLHELNLLEQFLPEYRPMIGCEQPPEFHPEGDVWVHTVMMLNFLKQPSPELALSVLLHDIGKPPTFAWGETKEGIKRIRFFGHAQVGARMAEEILTRLKFSKAQRETIIHCVNNHMKFGDVHKMRNNTVRKMIGHPDFETEMELHRVDCLSCHGMLDNYELLLERKEEYANEPVLPPALITGKDIMALGIPAGPEVGKWKNATYDQQLEQDDWDKDKLLAWLKNQIKS